MQLSLFNQSQAASITSDQVINQQRVQQVRGLRLIEDFISNQYEVELLAEIDKAVWDSSMKRRVQQYGYQYDYKNRNIDENNYLGPFPEWLELLGQMLQKHNLFEVLPEQAIINEYIPGQGIAAHIDCEPCFAERIVSISLGSRCNMIFDRIDNSEAVEIYIPVRSAVLLQGESRYFWRHSIPARKKDEWPDTAYRSRRISITFRNVIL